MGNRKSIVPLPLKGMWIILCIVSKGKLVFMLGANGLWKDSQFEVFKS